MPQESLPVGVLYGGGYDIASQSYKQTVHSPLETLVLKLGPLEDPDDVQGHELAYSVGKSEPGGRPMHVHVEVRQGYRDEDNRGIEIDSWVDRDVPHGDHLKTRGIPPEKARLISDYGDLSLRFTFTRG